MSTFMIKVAKYLTAQHLQIITGIIMVFIIQEVSKLLIKLMRVNQYLNIILKMLFFSISKIIIALVKKKQKQQVKDMKIF